MRGGCGCLLLSLAAMVVGFSTGLQGLYTAATNWSPTEMTCAEYVEQRPSATWLKLTECDADYLDTVYQTTSEYSNTMEKVWFPVQPSGSDLDTPAYIVVETDDAQTMSFIQKTFDDVESAENEIVGVLQAMQTFEEKKSVTVEGLVEFGWELDDDTYRQIGGLAENVGEDFVIIEQGATPSFIGSFAWIGLGFLGIFGLILMFAGMAADEE